MTEASPGPIAPGAASLPPGTRVADRYEIASVVGEGAHGIVYRARREPEGDTVALKILHRHLSGDPKVRSRFHREADILRRLQGEHVARALDFLEHDGLLVLVLEYVEGQALEDLLAERATLSPNEAVEIALQICAALGAAHAAGIIHRDLKPANVIVERPDETPGQGGSPIRVKVVDFGLGKVTHGGHPSAISLTEQGMIFGTPEYMSPEQARGEDADARSDLYALGVMLYQMTVGEVPFTGKSPIEVMTAHLREPVPSPRARKPSSPITPSLEVVILRALGKQPGDRYATARDFALAVAAARDATRVVSAGNILTTSQALDDTDLHLVMPDLKAAREKRMRDREAERALSQGSAAAQPFTTTEALASTESIPAPPPGKERSLPPPPAQPAPSPAAPTLAASAGPAPGASTSRGTKSEPIVVATSPVTVRTARPAIPAQSNRSTLIWIIVAILAAGIGVAIGALVGGR